MISEDTNDIEKHQTESPSKTTLVQQFELFLSPFIMSCIEEITMPFKKAWISCYSIDPHNW